MLSDIANRTFWIPLALLAAPAAAAQERFPIIDMHLHARSPDQFRGPQTVCTNRDEVEFPPVDPREETTVQKTATRAHPLMSARDRDENARRTTEMMWRYDIYVMHYGSPLVEEMIALLYSHPNVYVDVAQNDWCFRRADFYRQLKQVVDTEFGQRIMFGSDQMIWPETIPIAIETIQQAPFLTEKQRRDILYNNAARFRRLSEEEIARQHGK